MQSGFPKRVWHKHGVSASRIVGSEAEAKALGPDWTDKPPEPKRPHFDSPVHSARIVPGLPAKEGEAKLRSQQQEQAEIDGEHYHGDSGQHPGHEADEHAGEPDNAPVE